MQFDRLKRREFITLLGGAAAVWPLAGARAQKPTRRPLIAVLLGSRPAVAASFLNPFFQQLQALGYVEGRDYGLAVRYADGDLTRFDALASELVALRPAIIVTSNTTAAIAAKKATSTIPIVAAAMIEPVEKGLVVSHARPGGNLTGILISLDTLLGKQLQIGLELLPGVRKAGMPLNVTSSGGHRSTARCGEGRRRLECGACRCRDSCEGPHRNSTSQLVQTER